MLACVVKQKKGIVYKMAVVSPFVSAAALFRSWASHVLSRLVTVVHHSDRGLIAVIAGLLLISSTCFYLLYTFSTSLFCLVNLSSLFFFPPTPVVAFCTGLAPLQG